MEDNISSELGLPLTNCFSQIYDISILFAAAKKAEKGKRYRDYVLLFNSNRERNLLRLSDSLRDHSYSIGDYYKFTVRDPKVREIAALPYIDRIVQIALCDVIEPAIDKQFLDCSYACRLNRGVHSCSQQLQDWLTSGTCSWYLKMDVHHFFQSIDVQILIDIIKCRYVQDPDVLWLIETILHADCPDGKGVKIGNRFSQLAANIYLHELDQFVTESFPDHNYIRYMDDFIVLGHDKSSLRQVCLSVQNFLRDSLKLVLNHKTRIDKTYKGIEFVGYRVFKGYRLVKKAAVRRLKSITRKWRAGAITNLNYYNSISSRLGYANGTSSYKLYAESLLKSLHVFCADPKLAGKRVSHI